MTYSIPILAHKSWDVGLFRDAHDGIALPSYITEVITSGYHVPGIGAARYVYDKDLTESTKEQHPGAVIKTLDHRMFLLSVFHLEVEQFGAVGDGVSNDQPAVQAAINYAQAFNRSEVIFAAKSYAIYMRIRSSPHATHHYDGEPIIIDKQITLRGCGSTRSMLLYKDPEGRDLQSNWQTTLDHALWRGSGIFLRGYPSWNTLEKVGQEPPQDTVLPSITLIDITLDGGADRGPATKAVFPADPNTGNGWDWTHKGIYAEEDNYCGDITIIRSCIKRFRGELVYQGGRNQGALKAVGSIFSTSNGDLINPGPGHGKSIELVDCVFENGHQGFEGWGGRSGTITRCTFLDCFRGAGRLQGGVTNHGEVAALYYRPKRVNSNEIPWLTLDRVKFINCGLVLVGSFVRGKIYTIDSQVTLLSFGDIDEISCVDLTINASMKLRGDMVGAALAGSSQVGTMCIQNTKLKVLVKETSLPGSSGPVTMRPVSYYGSLGPNIIISGGSGRTKRFSCDELHRADGQGHDAPDFKPVFLNNNWVSAENDWTGCCSNIDLTKKVTLSGDRHLLFSEISKAEIIAVSLCTKGYGDGHEIRIFLKQRQNLRYIVFVSGVLIHDKEERPRLSAGQSVVVRFRTHLGSWEVSVPET